MDEQTTANEPKAAPAGGASKIGKAKEFLGERVASASESAKKTYGTVKEKVSQVEMDDVVGKVRGYVRENPGKALLMSVAAGFLIGLLLRRDRDE